MEAKLIKENNFYKLIKDNTVLVKINTNEPIDIHYSFGELSLKNCEAIERGYDIELLSIEYASCFKDDDGTSDVDFMMGFLKALEILGDKNFSEEDISKAIDFGVHVEAGNIDIDYKKYGTHQNQFIQSIQQTEWEVEIVMADDKGFIFDPAMGISQGHYIDKPKLDEKGKLILKRK